MKVVQKHIFFLGNFTVIMQKHFCFCFCFLFIENDGSVTLQRACNIFTTLLFKSYIYIYIFYIIHSFPKQMY